MESREKVRFLTTANTIVLQKLILKEKQVENLLSLVSKLRAPAKILF
jgi:hypothetical protein